MVELENILLKEDEVIKDDIIFCTKCNTPRMFVSEDGTFTARALCKCQSEEAEKRRGLQLQQEKFEKMKRLKLYSVLGPRYENSSFDNLDMDRDLSFVSAVERCRNFCGNWDNVKKHGAGIFIYGATPGTGKTEMVACIANELTQRLIPVLATNMLEISKNLRESYMNRTALECELIRMMGTIDLLIIDDLGVEKYQKSGEDTFLQDRFYDIINRRYVAKLPTLFTSNFSIRELIEERGLWPRTADRINEMAHASLKIEGTSYRPKLKKQNLLF